jgi:ubiquinone/menaquinone biosynthesis C-methylase UbiE
MGIDMDNNTVYEWLLPTTFSVFNRAKSLSRFYPYLSPLFQAGDKVLDLCCGTGPMAFWFEEYGAKVTAIDLASYMILRAKEEALRRNSTVEFIHANIFEALLVQEHYNLVSCFGNSISDFPLSDYAIMIKLITRILKPGGHFVIQYQDGSYKYIQGNGARTGVYQEYPERITFRFKEYLPDIGAYINIIENETRGQKYLRKGYIYTVPMVQLITCNDLELEQHMVLEENYFLDIFIKKNRSLT